MLLRVIQYQVMNGLRGIGVIPFYLWIQDGQRPHRLRIRFVEVDGEEPGSVINLDDADPTTLNVHAELISLAPVDKLEILVNGKVVHTAAPPGDGTRMTVDVSVEVPDGGWVAARAVGPSNRYVGDNYAFVQTAPVYVVRGGRPFTSADDAEFLMRVIDTIWQRVEARDAWRTEAEKQQYRASVEEAKAAYARAAQNGRQVR